MGLIDRDYMHEGRSRQAFTPAPEKSAVSTLFMVLVFSASLFFLYKLADWKINKRTSQVPSQTAQPLPQTIGQRFDRGEAFSPPPTREPSASASKQAIPQAGDRFITKCLANGKTSYGDGPCLGGAVATHVATRADHNIMMPVHVAVNIETEPTFSPAHIVIAQSISPPDHVAKKSECQLLDTHIKYLDSMSRQPQSGQTMDWIRDERKKARDRQFRISCQ